jgi:DNA-directed RNA polymerase specialized sigma24 family protein
MVYGLLRGSLNSRHDHDDLVQEIFLRVFRRLHTLENHAALRSFVYSVAVRVLSEEIRHFYVVQRARDRLVLMADTEPPKATDFESRDTLTRIQRPRRPGQASRGFVPPRRGHDQQGSPPASTSPGHREAIPER